MLQITYLFHHLLYYERSYLLYVSIAITIAIYYSAYPTKNMNLDGILLCSCVE
jgi:hypothetical protein